MRANHHVIDQGQGNHEFNKGIPCLGDAKRPTDMLHIDRPFGVLWLSVENLFHGSARDKLTPRGFISDTSLIAIVDAHPTVQSLRKRFFPIIRGDY